MALRKKKSDSESDSTEPSVLDRLTDLRHDIKGESAVTALIDILVDANGGDSEALRADIAEGQQSDAARAPEPPIVDMNTPAQSNPV